MCHLLTQMTYLVTHMSDSEDDDTTMEVKNEEYFIDLNEFNVNHV